MSPSRHHFHLKPTIFIHLVLLLLAPVGVLSREDADILVPTLALPSLPEESVFDDIYVYEQLSDETTVANPLEAAPVSPASGKNEDLNQIHFNSSIEPLMLYSTGTNVEALWMKTRAKFKIIGMDLKQKAQPQPITSAFSFFFDALVTRPQSKPHNTIVGIDMNTDTKEIVWAELGPHPGIFSTVLGVTDAKPFLESTSYNTVVESGLLLPEDVSVDHVTGNIYFTDGGLPAIVVCSVKQVHCKIIFKDAKLSKPRAIVVDSSVGWLTYTDWGEHPGIYLLSMDGKQWENLVNTDVVWPNALAADYPNEQLYWADARLSKIERIDLKTRKRQVILTESSSNPFSLTMFEDRLYWSDWNGNKVQTCVKTTGKEFKSLLQTDTIYGIHVYHPEVNHQMSGYNPCWSKRCSHLCLLSPETKKFEQRGQVSSSCACPESMILSPRDQSTCYEKHLSFLLINVENYIAQIFPERIGIDTVEKVIYSQRHNFHDMASDWLHYRLFFYDSTAKHIYVVDLKDQNAKMHLFMNTSRDITSMIYDPFTDNLYWLDTDQGSLVRCSVSGKVLTVLRNDLVKAKSVVLDRRDRFFYVASKGKITRIDVSSDRENDVVILSDLGEVTTLQLGDFRRIYWADNSAGTIESVALSSKIKDQDGYDRTVHRRGLSNIATFTVYRNMILWSSKKSDTVMKIRIASSPEERPAVIKLLPGSPRSGDYRRLITVNPVLEVFGNSCVGRNCSHGCDLDKTHKPFCFCPPKMILVNQTTCQKAKPNGTTTSSTSTTSTSTTTSTTSESSLPIHYNVHPFHEDHIDMGHDLNHNHDNHHAEHSIDYPVSEPIKQASSEEHSGEEKKENRMVWLIVLLMVVSIGGTIAAVGFILYKQGRIPKQVSQLSVSFMPNRSDKDGSMLLLDEES